MVKFMGKEGLSHLLMTFFFLYDVFVWNEKVKH